MISFVISPLLPSLRKAAVKEAIIASSQPICIMKSVTLSFSTIMLSVMSVSERTEVFR